MPTAQKASAIEQTREWYSKSSGVVFTDYRGLKVKEIQQLRSDLRKKGGELHVVKNTLFRIAAGDDAAKLPADLHNGTTAFAFVFGSEPDVAKALLDYARTSRKLIVKGGFFGGQALTLKEVEQLSELPPKEVLIAQVIGAIAAPLTTLISTIESLYAEPIRVIGAVADKVAEGSPIPASPAAVEAAPEAEPVAASDPDEATAEVSAPEAVEAEPVEAAASEPVVESTTESTPEETTPEVSAPTESTENA
jgi:large subunit ribosomal protein L10